MIKQRCTFTPEFRSAEIRLFSTESNHGGRPQQAKIGQNRSFESVNGSRTDLVYLSFPDYRKVRNYVWQGIA